MKIALFSDIHANIDALKPVLADIYNQKPDAVYCLGDLVGYAPYPNEVIDEIRSKGIPVIAGNHDQKVGLFSDDYRYTSKKEDELSNGEMSTAFTNQKTTKENRAYLRSLPAHLRLEFGVYENPWNLLLVHGSPQKINEYLFEEQTDVSLLSMMKKAKTHLMAFGHTHKPFHKFIQDEDGTYRHAINIGSVGKPKDGDPRACYVILKWDGDLDLTNPKSLSAEFIRIKYDVEKTAKAIEESPLPNEFAEMLRNGGS